MLVHKAPSKRQQLISQLAPRPGSQGEEILQSAKNTRTLFEWAKWLDEFQISSQEDRAFDPRLSEWASLEILHQLCTLMERASFNPQTRLQTASHPANFTVPGSWWDKGRKYEWRDWESESREQRITVSESVITDYRVAAALGLFPEQPTEFDLVRALGAILFGLLRRNFLWPMPWRVIGLQATFRGSVQQYLDGQPCSSRTLAILESTLLARSYESWILKMRLVEEPGLADDVQDDPPDIASLADLKDAVEKSMKTLEKYRLTVTELEPRQLIPLRVSQYTRKTWDPEQTEEGVKDE